MTDNEMLLQLIERARTKDYTKFRYLHNWKEYRYIRQTKKTLELTISALQKAGDNTLKSYCREVKRGTSEITKLVAFNVLNNTLKFYEEELGIINHMLYEYEAYLLEGNYVSAFLGSERSNDEFWDHKEN
jgi:hypothetical protein